MGFANQQANQPNANMPAFGAGSGSGSGSHRRELDEHMRPGGQTNAGEMPHGIGSEHSSMRAQMGTRIGATGRNEYAHPWIPETKAFQGEKTRRR